MEGAYVALGNLVIYRNFNTYNGDLVSANIPCTE